jgi:amino acid permease
LQNTASASDTFSAQPHGTSEMNGSQKEMNETHRGMKSRHLTMIGMYPNNSGSTVVYLTFFRSAIGGTIGTGIFLSAGIVRQSSSHFHIFA